RALPALLALALSLAGCSAPSCAGEEASDEAAAPARSLPPPDLRLAIVTDLEGHLAPCGCTSRPLGGIDRLAALVRDLREEGPPVAFVAAGSLLHGGAPAPSGAEVVDRWRAETLLEIFGAISFDAAALGRLDEGAALEAADAEGPPRLLTGDDRSSLLELGG